MNRGREYVRASRGKENKEESYRKCCLSFSQIKVMSDMPCKLPVMQSNSYERWFNPLRNLRMRSGHPSGDNAQNVLNEPAQTRREGEIF